MILVMGFSSNVPNVIALVALNQRINSGYNQSYSRGVNRRRRTKTGENRASTRCGNKNFPGWKCRRMEPVC